MSSLESNSFTGGTQFRGVFFFYNLFFSVVSRTNYCMCKGGEKNKWNERNTQAEGGKEGRERHDRKKERKGRNAKFT